jgi:hypothetical protein
MRAVSRTAIYAVIAVVLISGCASESVDQRYQENKAHARLSPRARERLRDTDVDEIARLIANSTRKKIIGICTVARDQHPNAFLVTIGIPWRDEPYSYGFYLVARDHRAWRIIERHEILSPSLAWGLAASDPDEDRSNQAMQRTAR